MKITNGKDVWAGLMFIAFGLGFMFVAQNYAMGNAVRMGPAYFPTVLGGLLAVLGAAVFLRAFVSKIEHPLAVFPFRLWLVAGGLVLSVIAFYAQPPRDAGMVVQIAHILFSVVIFGYMLKPLGLVLATGLLVFVSAWGGHEFKVKEVTILSVALAIFSVFAFVRGLGLPMHVWPSIWE